MREDSDRRYRRTVHWQLLYRCNLQCAYCWNDTRDHEVPTLPAERLLAAIDEVVATDVDQILFTGGEPFLVREMEQYLARAVAAGLPVGVITNGVPLSDARIDALAGVAAKGHLSLVLSLDAADVATNDDTRGATARVVELLDRMHQRRATAAIRVIVNTVVTTRNIDAIDALLDYTASRGVYEHRLDPAIFEPAALYPRSAELDLRQMPLASRRAALDRLTRAVARHRQEGALRLPSAEYFSELCGWLAGEALPCDWSCGATEHFLVITPEGAVLPCFERREPLADLTREPFARAMVRLRERGWDEPHPGPRPCFVARCRCSFTEHPPQL